MVNKIRFLLQSRLGREEKMDDYSKAMRFFFWATIVVVIVMVLAAVATIS